MHALLPTLASLASLSLLLPVSSLLSSSDLANLFPSPPPALPALRRLIIGGLGDPSPILLANPHLLHLHLADTDPSAPPLSLPPNALSELRAFRGPIGAAVALLPGRPVQGLALLDTCGTGSRSSGNTSNGGVSSADLARLAHTSAPLRVLDLGGVSVTPPLLRDVSRYLPHVEHLRVRLALRHTLHFALSGIRLLAALTPVLGAFHTLRRLDLSPTHAVDGSGIGAAGTAEEEERRLCAAWASACSSLCQIVFPSGTEWGREAGSHVWVSHAPIAVGRSLQG